jgi:hypothetical protein
VYFEATGDREVLMRFLPEIEEEMKWLREHRMIGVRSPRNNVTIRNVYLYRVSGCITVINITVSI